MIIVLTPKIDLYNDVKKYLGDKDEFDLESVLTVADDISNLSQFTNRFGHPSIRYLLNRYSQSDTINSYIKYEKSDIAISLKKELNKFIKTKCVPASTENGFRVYDEILNFLFPTGLKNCPIFTTNYDN